MFNYASIQNTRRVLAVLIFLVALSPFVTVVRDFNRAEARQFEASPVWDFDCMVSVRTEVVSRFAAEPTNPIEYFLVLDLARQLEAAFRRSYGGGLFFATGEEIRQRQILGAMVSGIPGQINAALERYHAKFNPRTMVEVSKLHYTYFNQPWQGAKVQWSPNLSWQFVSAFLWIGLLSFLSTFLAFWDAGNLCAFARRLPLIVPMAFTIGPLTPRWAGADRSLVASDVWLMTSFATAAVGLFMPGVVVVVKAQAPTIEKTKQTSSRSSSKDQKSDSETSVGDLVNLLHSAGISQVNVETLPLTADGKLREVSIEYLGAIKMGRLGSLKLFGFGELRPGSQFTNHSVSFFPLKKLPLGLMAEQGWNGKRFFGVAGVKWSISGTPGLQKPLGKVFDFATLSYTWKYAGAAPQRQLILVWDTKDWAIWKDKLGLSMEGFYRIRPGGTTNYGQPQILAQFGHCAWVKGLVQFDTAGRKVGVSAGAKFFFAVR